MAVCWGGPLAESRTGGTASARGERAPDLAGPSGALVRGEAAATIAATVSATATAGAAGSAATPTPSATAGPQADQATVAVVPASGPPQTRVMVSGTGLPAGDAVQIIYSDGQVDDATGSAKGIVLGSATAGADGSLAPVAETIPPAAGPGGIGVVVLRDASRAIGSALFGVTPLDHALSIPSGPLVAGGNAPGASAVVEGSGFAPGSAVRVGVLDAAGALVSSSGPYTSTTTGALGPLAVTIPVTSATGLGAVDAADSSGVVAGAPLRIVGPSDGAAQGDALRLQPGRAAIGESVSVQAGGFAAGEPIVISLQGGPGAFAGAGAAFDVPASGQMAADASGLVIGRFALPAVEGLTRLNGSGSGANQGSLLTVTLRGTRSAVVRAAPLVVAGTHLLALPPVSLPGRPIAILGEGFGAGERVSVSIAPQDGTASGDGGHPSQGTAGGATLLGVTQAADDGSVSLAGIAAPGGGGAFLVSAVGAATGLSATSRFSVTASPVLVLQPAVVAPGRGVEVHGAGFSAGAHVSVQVGGTLGPGISLGPAAAVADGDGRFVVSFTLPQAPGGAQGGVPVAVEAHDTAGESAAAVLTVNGQPATIRVTPRAALPGQVATVRGAGFGSGETVDVFLALPSAADSALARTAVPVVADAQGDFVTSYVLPQPYLSGLYLVGAAGVTSGRSAVYPMVIGGAQATPVVPRTPIPPLPTSTPDCGSAAGTAASVIYVPRVEAVQGVAAGAPAGRRLAEWDELVVENAGARQLSATVAYLLFPALAGQGAGVTAPVASRAVSFTLAPYSVIRRSVAADVGWGQVAAAVVRGTPGPGAGGCADAAQGAGGNSAVRVLVVAHRALLGGGLPVSLDGGAALWGTSQAAVATRLAFVDGPSADARGTVAGYVDVLNPQTVPVRVRVRVVTAYGGPSGPVGTATLPAFGAGRLDVGAMVVRARAQVCAAGGGRDGPAADRVTLGCGTHAPDGTGVLVEAEMPVAAQRVLLWGAGAGLARVGFDVAAAAQPLSVGMVSMGGVQGARVGRAAAGAGGKGSPAGTLLLLPAAPLAGACPRGGCGATVDLTVWTASGARVMRRTLRLVAGRRAAVDLGSLDGRAVYAIAIRATRPVFGSLAVGVGTAGAGAVLPLTEPMSGATVTGPVTTPCVTRAGCAAGLPRLRVLHASTGRAVVRVLGMSGSGVYYVQSYVLGPWATLELTLPPPGATGAAPAGVAPARGTGGRATRPWDAPSQTPIGISVECDSACAAAGLSGAGEAATNPAGVGSVPELWGIGLL